MLTVESMGMQPGGGSEWGGVMLEHLEHLLPIPTGAKMDRWEENGNTEDREEKRMK